MFIQSAHLLSWYGGIKTCSLRTFFVRTSIMFSNRFRGHFNFSHHLRGDVLATLQTWPFQLKFRFCPDSNFSHSLNHSQCVRFTGGPRRLNGTLESSLLSLIWNNLKKQIKIIPPHQVVLKKIRRHKYSILSSQNTRTITQSLTPYVWFSFSKYGTTKPSHKQLKPMWQQPRL